MSSNVQTQAGPLEAVRCDLCGSNRDRTFLTLPDLIAQTSDHIYRIGQCQSCGLYFLNPRPFTWQIAAFYPESYEPFTRRGLSGQVRQWMHRRTVQEFQSSLAAPKKVLDLGCGTGELLLQVRRSGNENIVGVEPSPQAARVAREQHRLNVTTGTLEQASFAPETFDTVLLSHVLEHLPSPRTTMQEVSRVLKPGGVVIIWVPNGNSLAARVMGRYWMGWDVPRHLYTFTPGTLHRLAEDCGLLPGEAFHERHGIEWSWGIRLMARERWGNARLDAALRIAHPAIGIAFTPLGLISSLIGSAGRVRMVCRKPVN